MTTRVTVAAHVPNMMDRSRFGPEVTFVSTPEDVVRSGAELVLVDIDRCDDLAGFRVGRATVIGFGSHVDADRRAAAVAAGYDEVLARSAFFRRLPDLLASGDNCSEDE